MSNTKNNHRAFKKRKTQDELHELFVQWLTMLLRDDHSRAEIRAMVEQHEIPVIDDAT